MTDPILMMCTGENKGCLGPIAAATTATELYSTYSISAATSYFFCSKACRDYFMLI